MCVSFLVIHCQIASPTDNDNGWAIQYLRNHPSHLWSIIGYIERATGRERRSLQY